MNANVSEWLNLLVRWLHVVAGILWIGQTAFFSWLDSRLTVEAEPGEKETIWMVHSGGFYVVERQAGPQVLPRVLHWFRWEAAVSWISGMMLLLLVYYHGGLLVEYDSQLGTGTAIAISLAVLAAGWLIYDLLWISPLVRWPRMVGLVSFALLVAVGYGLTQMLSGRAAYIHVGALIGTIMTANVWMRILPAQRRMVEAARAGREADLNLGGRAKERSKHNTFLAIPLIFIMISNHFPTASYGHAGNWLMLALFFVLGFVGRWLMSWYNARP